jgi:hypothetical protein
MNLRLFFVTLLIVLPGAAGCGAPQPPMACTEETFPGWDDGDFTLAYCEELGLVCNEAVTLADACPAFLVELETYFDEFLVPELMKRLPYLPWQIDIEALVERLFGRLSGGCDRIDILDQVATCQPAGNEGEACLEDADCSQGLVCQEEICAVP